MSHAIVDIAIIGAGTAGCLAAKRLSEAGLACCIIEKSRGLGGRCSRRSSEDFGSIDLGASSFSTSNIENQTLLASIRHWVTEGHLSEWHFNSSGFQQLPGEAKQVELCGTPSMNAFHRYLAGNAELLTQQRVHTLKRLNSRWQLQDERNQLIVEASAVIVTAPAEQTYNLVGQYEYFSNAVLEISQSSLPQYVCAIAIDQPFTHSVDLFQGDHPVFSKAIRVNSKPSYPIDNTSSQIWLLHSTHEWAQQQHNQDAEIVADKMRHLFCRHFSIASQAESTQIITSHYWRLAGHGLTLKSQLQGDPTTQPPFLWDQKLQLGCCADWLSGGGIAGALNSSQTLSDHITSQLTQEV